MQHVQYNSFTRWLYMKVSELNYSVIDSFIKKLCSFLMSAPIAFCGASDDPEAWNLTIILQEMQWSCFGVEHSGCEFLWKAGIWLGVARGSV